jgi:hypothetical protein
VQEKAVSALESLLFAKYQMFRNVYWHHAVRAATALYRRIVDESVRLGVFGRDELVGPTDEELLYRIQERTYSNGNPMVRRIGERWIPNLRSRRLPKRACELTAAELEGIALPDWLSQESPVRRGVEDRIAEDLGLEAGEVMLDYPVKARMLDLDLLVERRGGAVERLHSGGLRGVIDLPRLAEELYRTARVLRIFTVGPRTIEADEALGYLAAG